jgi:hypothetical protein
MAKDPANMSHSERMTWLAGELNSSSGVSKADKVLDLIKHEWLDVLAIRDIAARRSGDTSPAPTMPTAPSDPKSSSPPQSQNEGRALGLTWASLADRYRTDEGSPFLHIRYATRENYDAIIKRILAERGEERLANVKASDIGLMYERWTEGGKLAMAHALIGMVRTLINYGAAVLKDAECERLAVPLHRMRARVVNPRVDGAKDDCLTVEQATLIIAKAHQECLPSIALAQAFQFDCQLRQKDVIGEWVPLNEKGTSDVIDGDVKWVRGLRWEEIDSNFVLRHDPGLGRKEIVFNLRKQAPRVMAELERLGTLPKSGPIVKYHLTGLPYRPIQFRRSWRVAANAAGIPKHIKNMDSRVVGREANEKVSDEQIDEMFRDAANIEIDATAPRH